jgi:hypothetical protein
MFRIISLNQCGACIIHLCLEARISWAGVPTVLYSQYRDGVLPSSDQWPIPLGRWALLLWRPACLNLNCDYVYGLGSSHA